MVGWSRCSPELALAEMFGAVLHLQLHLIGFAQRPCCPLDPRDLLATRSIRLLPVHAADFDMS